MPELPEVQTVVNNLSESLIGKSILSVKSPNKYKRVFHQIRVTDCNQLLLNNRIEKITRRGKYIVFILERGFFCVHLRMTGKLLINLENKEHIKYVSAQFNFTDGSQLFFKDVRKFGRIYFSNNLDWLELKLGIEPLTEEFNSNYLYNHLQKKNRMMKPLLMDQTFIAGLGNIYVDEVLWSAGIHPSSISSYICKQKAEILCFAIKDILTNAIKKKGTTFQNFSFGENEIGEFKHELKIFGRTNKPCLNCGNPITKIKIAQRGTHFCKKCQPH